MRIYVVHVQTGANYIMHWPLLPNKWDLYLLVVIILCMYSAKKPPCLHALRVAPDSGFQRERCLG